MKLKINLYGETFRHNLVDGVISSTVNKKPSFIEYVEDGTGSINLFVDLAILEAHKTKSDKPNYGWLLESNCIHPQLVEKFKNNQSYINYFNNIFTHNLELTNLSEKFKFMYPTGYWVDEIKDIKKTKLISMIASSKKSTVGQKKRNKIARKYKNKVDLFGEGRNFIKKKEEGLLDYCFSIVVENDFTDNYFSEKILDCFATKTVPIYIGSKNIKNFFDMGGIIFYENFNFKKISFENYYEKLNSIENNFKLVQEYKIPEDTMYKDYLRFFRNNI